MIFLQSTRRKIVVLKHEKFIQSNSLKIRINERIQRFKHTFVCTFFDISCYYKYSQRPYKSDCWEHNSKICIPFLWNSFFVLIRLRLHNEHSYVRYFCCSPVPRLGVAVLRLLVQLQSMPTFLLEPSINSTPRLDKPRNARRSPSTPTSTLTSPAWRARTNISSFWLIPRTALPLWRSTIWWTPRTTSSRPQTSTWRMYAVLLILNCRPATCLPRRQLVTLTLVAAGWQTHCFPSTSRSRCLLSTQPYCLFPAALRPLATLPDCPYSKRNRDWTL